MINPFRLAALRIQDIAALVEARVAENQGLEYKVALPGRSDAERKEFLADVTSIANGQGGVILYGVSTRRDEGGRDTGIPESLVGLPDVIPDQVIQRLEAMLRDGVEPSLTAQVQFKVIEQDADAPPILALAAFKSFAGPHQVTFAGSRRFWLRGQTGKYEPDVTELRQLFLKSASWLAEADELRSNRFQLVASSERVERSSITLVHLLPLAGFDRYIDLPNHQNALTNCAPLEPSGWSWRFNGDGFMTYVAAGQKPIPSYTQWFRTGGVEGFSSGFVGELAAGNVKMLWLKELRSAVVTWLEAATPLLFGQLSVEPPYAVLLSLGGVADAHIPGGRSLYSGEGIEPNHLLLPPLLYDPTRDNIGDLLAPIFDIIAQSAGLARAPQ